MGLQSGGLQLFFMATFEPANFRASYTAVALNWYGSAVAYGLKFVQCDRQCGDQIARSLKGGVYKCTKQRKKLSNDLLCCKFEAFFAKVSLLKDSKHQNFSEWLKSGYDY